MKLKEYADADLMEMDLAHRILGQLKTVLSHAPRASLVVPGGTSPGPIFDQLGAASSVAWDRVDVLLTDERWVPADHPRSNAGLVRRRLLNGPAAAARFHPYFIEGVTPAEAAEMLEDRIAAMMPFSVVLLGMGEDMHTASLFPGGDTLAEALADDAPPLLAIEAPGAEEPRLTLSAAAINGAMAKHLIIAGAARRAALDRALALKDPMRAPVAAVLDDLLVHWVKDA